MSLGGFDGFYFNPTTEIWDNKTWHDHIPLPKAMSGHCLVKINSTHVFLAGGKVKEAYRGYGEKFSESAYLYSKDSGFVKQEDMMWSWGGMSCVLLQEGQVMVSSARRSSKKKETQMFDLSTLQWSAGPSLPTALFNPKLLSMDGKTFLLGGFDNSAKGGNKKIWQLNQLKLSTMNVWRWVEIGELADERSLFDIVPITAEYCASNDN